MLAASSGNDARPSWTWWVIAFLDGAAAGALLVVLRIEQVLPHLRFDHDARRHAQHVDTGGATSWARLRVNPMTPALHAL